MSNVPIPTATASSLIKSVPFSNVSLWILLYPSAPRMGWQPQATGDRTPFLPWLGAGTGPRSVVGHLDLEVDGSAHLAGVEDAHAEVARH